MINLMQIGDYKATIAYDPEIEMFRGEFVGLNGGADFYARDIDALRREGERSLAVFLEGCARRGIEPRKPFSGRFNVRIDPALHEAIAAAAQASGLSLNQWVEQTLRASAEESREAA
jgi:predicted HicB family RNase H-like nuclease